MSPVNTIKKVNESKRCESPLYKTDEEYNIAVIYHNDYIMANIVAHIPEFENRIKMRLVSQHLRKVVDKAGYVTPFIDRTIYPNDPSCDELFIGYPFYQQSMYVVMGSFEKVHDICNRKLMDIEDEPKQLHPPIMNILKNTLFLRKNVEVVTFGKRENDNHCLRRMTRFVVTRDLLMHMEHFVNLHTVQMWDAVFNQEAQDYILSDECKFKNRIETLKLKIVNQGPWQLAMITKHLEHLELLNLDDIGEIAEKMEKMNLMLDTVRLTLMACVFTIEETNNISKIAKHSKKLVMELTGDTPVDIGHALERWQNIVSLYLKPHTFVNIDDSQLDVMFQNVANLRNLEKLELSGGKLMSKWIELAKAIQPTKNLKELIINFSWLMNEEKEQNLRQFLTFLPHSIETMTISIFWMNVWTDDLLDSFTTQFANNWKSLKFGSRRYTIENKDGNHERAFKKIVTNMNLTKLEFCYKIGQEDALQCLLDHQQLDEVQLFISYNISLNVERVMRDHFENYESDGDFDPHVKASKRKPGTLKFVE